MALILALLFQAADPDAAAALERLNLHRKAAGLGLLALDPALSKGCKLHAEYIARNEDHPSTQGLGAHDEDPKLPGYTKEGQKAGVSSDISFFPDGVDAVEGWMASLFHRMPIMHPHLQKIGWGWATSTGARKRITVCDLSGGIGGGRRVPFVVYPGEKQKDVSLAFRMEVPNPIPEDPDSRGGYPVTAWFADGPPVKEVQAALKDGDGKDVEFWLSTPEKPADARYQRNSICLIAKEPFKPSTTYTVGMSASLGGKRWQKSWTFTTAAK
jgi:hypothetical protein